MAITVTITTVLSFSATNGKSFTTTITGTSDPSSTIVIMLDPSSMPLPYNLFFGIAPTDGGGNWSLTLSGLPNDIPNTYVGTLTANATLGNSSGQSSQTDWLIVLNPACKCTGPSQPCPCSKCAKTKCPPVQVVSGRGSSS